VQQVTEPDADALFEMALLFPRTTGLPMTVWVSPRGNARRDARVKVNMTHGEQMNIANTTVVGVCSTPHVVAGYLSPDDQREVFEWISLNTTALVRLLGRSDRHDRARRAVEAASVATTRRSVTFPIPASGSKESMAAAIDGEIFRDAYLAPLNPKVEIYLIPKIGGG
jgi:hypothetical protein